MSEKGGRKKSSRWENWKASSPIKVVIIGAGQRGSAYATYGMDFPEKMKVVGVAEPRRTMRSDFQKAFSLPDDKAFRTWEECVRALEAEKFADAVVIATPDRLHVGPAIACANLKLHILLEKPMATNEKDCRAIYQAVKRNEIVLAVCHVLRYSGVAEKLREYLENENLGNVVHIQHTEPVGYWHFAHSFVRGNWRNEQESTFSLMAKCCHDVDLIAYWQSRRKCVKISSFGTLRHFKASEKPAGAGSRCLDCSVEKDCPYSAKKIYLDRLSKDPESAWRWPVSVICDVEDFDQSKILLDEVTKCLQEGPYGKCVYDTDNDVNDNQIVMFEFDDGSTATLTMIAFSESLCDRYTTFYGTRGQMGGCFSGKTLEHFDFLTREKKSVPAVKSSGIDTALMGHGGTDFYLMDGFIKAVSKNDPTLVLTGVEESLKSHLLVFAAETARRENRVVTIQSDPQFFTIDLPEVQ